jgi:hypothetical protein
MEESARIRADFTFLARPSNSTLPSPRSARSRGPRTRAVAGAYATGACEHVLKRRTWPLVGWDRVSGATARILKIAKQRLAPCSLRDRESPRWLPVVSRSFLETACCLKRPDWLAGVAGFELRNPSGPKSA